MILKDKLVSFLLAADMSLNLMAFPVSAERESDYTDVEENQWYTKDVKYCQEKGLMSGSPDPQHFSPDESTSRAMLVTILHRREGKPAAPSSSFEDVLPDAWNSQAISWANQNGIVTGYNEKHFGPSDPLSREQMALIMMRYAAYKNENTGQRAEFSYYQDADEINPVMKEAMQWAISKGLLGQGVSRLSPKSAISRAEAAAVLTRYFSRQEKEAASFSNSNAIYDLQVIGENQIEVEYSAKEAATIAVQVLDAGFEDYKTGRIDSGTDSSTVLTAGKVKIEPSMKDHVVISLDHALPSHYILVAMMQSENGPQLISPFYDLEKTQAFETFLNTGYEDLLKQYEPERILRLGEGQDSHNEVSSYNNINKQLGENLAVLNENVKILEPERLSIEYVNGPGSAITGYTISNPAKVIDKGDEIESAGSQLESLQPGDLICLKGSKNNNNSQDGREEEVYLFKLHSMQEGEDGNGLLLIPEMADNMDPLYQNRAVSDFYSFLRVETDQDLIHIDNSSLSSTVSENSSLQASGNYSADLSLNGSFYYDRELFGEKYYCSSLSLKQQINSDLHLSADNNTKTMEEIHESLTLSPERSYPTGIPGLSIQAGVSLPVSGTMDRHSSGSGEDTERDKEKGSLGGILSLAGELFLVKDTISQNQTGYSLAKDFLPETQTAGKLDIGLSVKAELDFDPFLSGDLGNTFTIHVQSIPTDEAHPELNTEGRQHHCSKCYAGKALQTVDIQIGEQAQISSGISMNENEAITSGMQDYQMPGTETSEFYTSLASQESSAYQGWPRRGFGLCRNLSYLAQITLLHPDGTLATNQYMKVYDSQGNFVSEGASPIALQLKTGSYKIITNYHQFDQSLPFSMGEKPEEMTMKMTSNFYPLIPHFEDRALAEKIQDLMASYGMNPDNLCIIVENLQTGAYYGQNEYRDFFAASTYKLPLAMLYYEDMLRKGIDPSHPDSSQSIGGLSLPVILDYLHRSIVFSENEPAMALFNNLGGLGPYTLMRQKYRSPSSSILLKYWDKEAKEMRKDGAIDGNAQRFEDESCSFYVDGERLSLQLGYNYIDGDYLKNVLEYLYANQDRFPLLLQDLSQAQSTDFLNTKLPGYYYQKYGLYENFLNIAGIHLKGSPYICLILTQYEPHARSFMADMGVLCKEYFNPES